MLIVTNEKNCYKKAQAYFISGWYKYFIIEYLVETVSPVSHGPDMQGDGVRLLRCRGDRERMPLEVRDGRNIQEYVVARLEVEVRRPFDDQVDHLGGQDHAVGYVALALVREGVVEAERLLEDEEAAGPDEPLPEVWRVKHDQRPEHQVQEVSPVEYLQKIMLIQDMFV